MPTEKTTADLQADTGESVRTLQYWTDIGLLRSIPTTVRRGRGLHRIFRADPPFHGERTWALIASEMNKWRLPIGMVKQIIDRMRENMRFPEKEPPIGWKKLMDNNPIGRALQGKLVLVLIGLGEAEPSISFVNIEENEEDLVPTVVFEKGLIGNQEDFPLYERLSAKLPAEFLLNSSSGYLLNLTRTLHSLRSE
jgi:hypothetical protein